MFTASTFTRTASGNCVSSLLLGWLVSSMVGCAAKPSPGDGSSPPPASYTYLTGNWEFVPTPASGSAPPFTLLAGFINESDDQPGVNDFLTAALQVQSTTCYSDSPDMSLQGVVLGTPVGLTSFPVENQVLTISAAKNSSAPQLTGTYSIAGGCGNGQTGSIYGNLYSPLNGTYTGAIVGSSPAKTIELTLAQYSQGAGDGRSFVTGVGKFLGFACFTTASLSVPDGYVLGRSASFLLTTNEAAGSQIALQGMLDQAADTLTITSIVVSGGACSGSYGATTLAL